MAAKTEDLADKKLKEKASWSEVNKVYSDGRKSIIEFGTAVYGSKKKAEELANQLLKAPPAAKLKVDKKAAEADLNAFNAAVKRSPGTKKVTLQTLSKTAETVLESFGFKVTHLKNGSVSVTAKTGGALSGIGSVARAMAALHDKTVSITSIHNVITNSKTFRSVHDITGKANGGLRRLRHTGRRADLLAMGPRASSCVRQGPGPEVPSLAGGDQRGPGAALRQGRQGQADQGAAEGEGSGEGRE
jgi:virulence-associated protein VapD